MSTLLHEATSWPGGTPSLPLFLLSHGFLVFLSFSISRRTPPHGIAVGRRPPLPRQSRSLSRSRTEVAPEGCFEESFRSELSFFFRTTLAPDTRRGVLVLKKVHGRVNWIRDVLFEQVLREGGRQHQNLLRGVARELAPVEGVDEARELPPRLGRVKVAWDRWRQMRPTRLHV